MDIKKILTIFTLIFSIFSEIKPNFYEITDLGNQSVAQFFIHKRSNSILFIKYSSYDEIRNALYDIKTIKLDKKAETQRINNHNLHITNIEILSNHQNPTFISTWQQIFPSYEEDLFIRRFRFNYNIDRDNPETQNEFNETVARQNKTSVRIFDNNGNQYEIATISAPIKNITTNKNETKLFCTTKAGRIVIVDIPREFEPKPNPTKIEIPEEKFLTESQQKEHMNNICVSPNGKTIVTGSNEIQRSQKLIPNQEETVSNTILNFWKTTGDNNAEKILTAQLNNDIKNIPPSGRKQISSIDTNDANQVLVVQNDKIYIYDPHYDIVINPPKTLATELDSWTEEEIAIEHIAKAKFIDNSLIFIQLRGRGNRASKIRILDSSTNQFKYTIKINNNFRILSGQASENHMLYILVQRESPQNILLEDDAIQQTYLITIPLFNTSGESVVNRELTGEFLPQNEEIILNLSLDQNNQPTFR